MHVSVDNYCVTAGSSALKLARKGLQMQPNIKVLDFLTKDPAAFIF